MNQPFKFHEKPTSYQPLGGEAEAIAGLLHPALERLTRAQSILELVTKVREDLEAFELEGNVFRANAGCEKACVQQPFPMVELAQELEEFDFDQIVEEAMAVVELVKGEVASSDQMEFLRALEDFEDGLCAVAQISRTRAGLNGTLRRRYTECGGAEGLYSPVLHQSSEVIREAICELDLELENELMILRTLVDDLAPRRNSDTQDDNDATQLAIPTT